MKRLSFVWLLAAALVRGAPAEPEQQVLAAMYDWRQGVLKRDAATLERIFHPDLAYSHSTGRTETKPQAIESATRGATVVAAFDILEQHVRVYGKTALVRAIIDVKNVNNGNATTLRLSMLLVWLETPRGWQMAARQTTRLNP